MIEFALLFALGFLTAAILGLLAAPVVHRRIVRFAEDRLKATMPLSPQEVRAQKDAARAGYAAENARISQTLKRERDRTVALMVENGTVLQDLQRLAGENADLSAQIADMNVEAADLRSAARQREQNIERLKATLADLERDNSQKSEEISLLTHQVDSISADADSLKIDVAAYGTEAENLKTRIAGLRDERERLRNELKTESNRGRELEARLARDDIRIRQFEAKLAREIAINADKDNFLERRAAEIGRLKAKLKDATAELRDASRALRAAGIALPVPKENREPVANLPSDGQAAQAVPTLEQAAAPATDNQSAEQVRERAAALSEQLVLSKTTAQDDIFREEIAGIAAAMVALTATREGEASPIPALLAVENATPTDGGKNLASRASALLSPEGI